MKIGKKQIDIGPYRLGALWGDYNPRFMDFLDSLQHALSQERITEDEKDWLLLKLQDVVDQFMAGDVSDMLEFMSSELE